MQLLNARFENFRNLAQVELPLGARASVAVGENGQGKTNLLEGLYLLATLKPLRASRLSELVQWGAQHAKVSGRFVLKGAEREIAVELSMTADGRALRQAYVDGKSAASLDEYFGGVSVVAFTPDDLAVVKGGPDGRRSFLDRSVFNRFPAYLEEARQYQRALKSRNRLLKDNAPVSHLQAWDETLSKLGAKLWVRRRAFVAELSPKAKAAFDRIGRSPMEASFEYLPEHLDAATFARGEEELSQKLRTLLEQRLPRDLERGFTSAGPHSDDLELSLGGKSARSFASQGQSRALVLAWKVAEIENLLAATGLLPLLLLDDVSSELDPERNAFLMGYLRDSGAQTFLTTTDAGLVAKAAGDGAKWFDVKGGTVSAR
ncbi:MAG: DNA replication/repair protein RecF [Myxococcaceae bacterium]